MKSEVDQKDGEKQLPHPSAGAENAKDKNKGKYPIQVNDFHLAFHEPIVTGEEILKAAGFDPIECYVLYQKFKDCEFERVSLHEKIDLSKPGPEKFEVKPTDIFHYTVDEEPETSDEKFMTASEILAAAGLDPKNHYLVEVFADGKQKSYKDKPNEPIELRCPGNKFISVFNGATPVS